MLLIGCDAAWRPTRGPLRGLRGEEPVIRESLEEVGVCPSCGSPLAVYKYLIEGPLEARGRIAVRISLEAECEVCGYRERKSVSMPVSAANALRLLMNSRARLAIEKISIIAELRGGSSIKA